MRVIQIKAAAGSGKTVEVLKRIATSSRGPFEIYVPTHTLACEGNARLKDMNPTLRIAVIKGRDHPIDNKTRFCKKHKQAAALIEAGHSVFALLCRQATGKDKPPIKCEHYDQCPYIHQFSHSDVYIYTHAYLPLQRSGLERHIPYGVVIDESFVLNLAETVTFNVTRLTDLDLPADAVEICAELANAIRHDPDSIRPIVLRAVSSGEWKRARKALRRSATEIKPGISRQEFNAAIKRVCTLKPINTLFDNLGRSRRCGHPPQSVEFNANDGTVTVHHRKSIDQRFRFRRPGAEPEFSPTLALLDASASPLLTRCIFSDFRSVDVPMARHARVVQCSSTRCSTTSLDPKRNSHMASKATAKRRLADTQKFISRLSDEGRRVLIVGPTKIVGNPSKNVKPLLKCPKTCEFAHFNSLRGIDRWKHFDTVVV